MDHIIVEVTCRVSDIETITARLLSDAWRQFAYIDLCIRDMRGVGIVCMPVDANYAGFVRFLRGDCVMSLKGATYHSYLQALNLRHCLLAFGMRPEGSIATRAHMVVMELIAEYSNTPHAWDMLSMGWDAATNRDVIKIVAPPSGDQIFPLMTAGVARVLRVRELLVVALLPICEDTIDIMNPETIRRIYRADFPTDREKRLRDMLTTTMSK